MRELGRLFAMAAILFFAMCAWFGLAAVMASRSDDQSTQLQGKVADLWGEPLVQVAPQLALSWYVDVPKEERVTDEHGVITTHRTIERTIQSRPLRLASSHLTADLHLDQRRKGLLWFSLYDVVFGGDYTVVHDGTETGTLSIVLPFPSAQGAYDDFSFTVNGVDQKDALDAVSGEAHASLPMSPGDKVAFHLGYKSRGLGQWSYRPSGNGGDGGQVGQLSDFELAMSTDFADIDYPAYTMSPSTASRDGQGWKLDWKFGRLVTSHGMGMVMPERIQPGPLAAAMSLSAPISLGLFMLWIYVLGLLKGIDVHPVNHLFLAAAFFAFHLLFGYTADHLPVEAAFALSAAVSVTLVVTYLRLVVGPRFAFVEAGLAQLVYLVGFALAHFWEGYTGLTVTVLGIATLFALMQLTGRIKWSNVFGAALAPPTTAAGASSGAAPRADR